MGTLTVSHIGKAYKRYPSKWARAREWITGKTTHEKTWVLRDINFTVNPGEAVGIVGVNGAGKSTLLKIITGTTQPTAGSLHTQGRVAALLELGMGFHPDFTGRQNARMAGQLAGLSVQEVEDLLPEIEKFADVGDYFDRPVRIYSSGMQARVAFAVATATTPDILIIDEALSVGDIAFQAKCMQRMQIMLDQGVAVLFVSHALNQVRHFCSQALYLKDGGVKAWGAADKVCDMFQNDLSGHSNVGRVQLTAENSTDQAGSLINLEKNPDLRRNSIDGGVSGTLELEFLNFSVLDATGQPVSMTTLGEKIIVRTAVLANKCVDAGAAVGLLFSDKNGFPLVACNTNYYDKYLPKMQSGDVVIVEWIFKVPFALGEFRVDVGVKSEPLSSSFFDRVFCVATLAVAPPVDLLKRNFGGYLFVDADVNVQLIGRQFS
ncbi:ABC transporter ATP-binding protein [Diaphorobacter nitroreducens]|uniref:ABC transporter ATP-binding protein n=1 Tax=Diaphorobacter nitroreducens TaxID=164759 RepID=UPI002899B93F|nr:ABC transporter ATP-binding protein [Diaphorobacter nitroreducens]